MATLSSPCGQRSVSASGGSAWIPSPSFIGLSSILPKRCRPNQPAGWSLLLTDRPTAVGQADAATNRSNLPPAPHNVPRSIDRDVLSCLQVRRPKSRSLPKPAEVLSSDNRRITPSQVGAEVDRTVGGGETCRRFIAIPAESYSASGGCYAVP